ncbi:MAG: carbohydrate ABC transporter permease [Verrucomicrobia bacterium]|nr:carbohydrate ABC transporter permease [Verrucomicrobiota bacterium]
MLAGSLRPNEKVLALGWQAMLPMDATLDNYRAVFRQLDFTHFFLNSLLIVGSVVLAGLLVNSMAGYALARLRWRGRATVLAAVIVLLIIPYEAIVVPLFFEMTFAGWTNSFRAQIVPFIANPFAIYLFYTFFNGLPRELEEAARVDGAGPWRTFFFIIAPLAKPAYAAVAILTFLLHWGFFLWPLMVTRGPEYQPLPVALGYFSSNKPVQWGDIMAFGTLMVVPVLAVFLVFQKWFVRGIAMTGVKG